MSSETKKCQNCSGEFKIEPEDFKFYEKIKVPPPTWCPECRAQRRLIWRNERSLYKKKSDYSGEEIFSMYSPQSRIKIYENNIWYGDSWNPLDYGRDVDFSKPFLKQYFELLIEVPRPASGVLNMVNSEYCNAASDLKNCYLIFNSNNSENCSYGSGFSFSKDSLDSLQITKCELCYEAFWLSNAYRVFFSSNCENSHDIWFSKNLRGCSNCFGCNNLRNKSYYIFNKPFDKATYEKKIKEFNLGSFSELEDMVKKVAVHSLSFPYKFMEGSHSTDVSGMYIYNSKNVRQSYLIRGGENVKYSQALEVPSLRDVYDHSYWGDNIQLTYECSACGIGVNKLHFTTWCWGQVNEIQYSLNCQSSSNLFGCVGLKNKQYCILNKQYIKKEYEELVSRIIKHMNEMPYVDKNGKPHQNSN